MKDKKILIITHNYPQNRLDRQNAGIFVHDFAKELIRQKVKVFVLCPGIKEDFLKIEGVPVFRFAWRGDKKLGQIKLWNPLELFDLFFFFKQGLRRLYEIVERKEPDVCLAMWAFPSGVFTYFLKKKFNVPYLIWALGSDIYVYAKLPLVGVFIKKVLKEAKILLADGIDLSREVKKISGRRCEFLPSASSFESFSGSRQKKDGKTVLSFVGRMELVKGPDIFLEALARIKNSLNKFEVNFVGDGSLLPLIKQKARVAGIAEFIKFHGNLTNKLEIARILSGSHWLIIPSRSDSIPLVFSEGMKNGVPVVAASLPDLRYLVNKYKVGIHFQPESVERLADILITLPKRKRERTAFSRNTKKAAVIFNISQSARKFLTVIYG